MRQAQPAKITPTQPLFSDKSEIIVKKLGAMSQLKLQKSLQISKPLAKLNYDRYASWDEAPKRAAAWMYSGDVYNGIDAYSMDDAEIEYAQKQVLIVSGLYGLVRPLDDIQPYRLEMKLPLSIGRSKNLYEYWADEVNKYLTNRSDKNILICASKEYSRLIIENLPKNTSFVVPRFMQETENGLKEKGLFAKYARGALARWAIDNKISSTEQLQEYIGDDFEFSPELSSSSEFVYLIPQNFSLKGRFVKR